MEMLRSIRTGGIFKKFLTRYAKANAAYGLKRGIMESESDNVPLKDFMKMVSQAARTDYTKAISEVIEEIAGNLSFMNSKAAVEKVLYEKLLPKLNPMLKSNKALKKLFSTSREGEYKALELLKKNLETELIAAKAERKALAEKAEYYGKGLKIRMQLESEISDLRAISKGQSEIISKLEAENFGLKQKQLSKTALNRTPKPGQIY